MPAEQVILFEYCQISHGVDRLIHAIHGPGGGLGKPGIPAAISMGRSLPAGNVFQQRNRMPDLFPFESRFFGRGTEKIFDVVPLPYRDLERGLNLTAMPIAKRDGVKVDDFFRERPTNETATIQYQQECQ